MEGDVIKQFSQEVHIINDYYWQKNFFVLFLKIFKLASLYDSKPPISKAKMVQVTKTAIKGIKYYKHIVMAVEKFIHRVKTRFTSTEIL